jgi:hypothetical protein
MDSFYCVGCRFSYPLEKAGHLATGAHRDGDPVGFCFVCTRNLLDDDQSKVATQAPAVEVETSEPAASA